MAIGTTNVDVNGVSLWTETQGKGPPLVLCHGGPGMYDYLGPVADMVDDIATVYRYDQRGSGRSGRTPPYTVDTFVEDLDALRRYWGNDRWIVGGNSWGADLAIAYCLRYSDRATALNIHFRDGHHAGLEGRIPPPPRS